MDKDQILTSLRGRGFEAVWAERNEEALNIMLAGISAGSCVAWGGSVTLNQLGIKEALHRRGDVTLFNRDIAVDAEDKHRIQVATFGCDYYLMGTNALTVDGLLVNIDGMGNRLAALMYGPRVVYVVVGVNKVCANETEALDRVRNLAAPANVKRLGRKTPCAVSGECHDCLVDDCICSHIVITRRSWVPKRIRVILVNETLGI
jgi:hypothetical protein